MNPPFKFGSLFDSTPYGTGHEINKDVSSLSLIARNIPLTPLGRDIRALELREAEIMRRLIAKSDGKLITVNSSPKP